MQRAPYSVSKGVKIGVLGGIVGSIVLGLFAELASATMSQEVFYVTIAKKLGLGDASIIGGWTMHFIVGLVAGAVFIGVTAQVKIFTLTNTRKALWVGVLAGIAIWIIVYVPVTWLLVPADLTRSHVRRRKSDPSHGVWDGNRPSRSGSSSQKQNNHY